MSDSPELKEPTEAQIRTGYMLHRARRKSVKYVWEARKCALQAAGEAKEAGDIAAVVEIERLTGEMLTAAGNFETDLADVHNELRSMMREAGYAEITDEQFKEFGGGGPR